MNAPLAEQLRPQALNEIFGQDHLLTENGIICLSIKSGIPLSMILWGTPGCGKTSLARIYAKCFSMRFECLSPIFSGIADLKKIIKDIEERPLLNRGTLLFVDEIHRFNKAQQDAFLPYLEKGTITLVGATAENPSFYLNPALLSRLRVLELKPLNEQALDNILSRYESKRGSLNLTTEAKNHLIQLAQGDGRYLLNLIENLHHLNPQHLLGLEELQEILQKRAPLYDKKGDRHYNLISALHKSVRGSDPDAAIYWFSRMLAGGEEPLFLARRLIRMAVEDIGLADPHALTLAVAARDAYEMLGSPEGELALAEVVVYLALAPKSNAIYSAFSEAKKLASESMHMDPPKTILNAPTSLMKEKGYGDGYIYDHDTPQGFSGQDYFPEGIERHHFYRPFERGFEREMIKRIAYFNKQRENLKEKGQS